MSHHVDSVASVLYTSKRIITSEKNSINFVEGYEKPSLDRIDSDGGYVDENIWIICTKCNTKKSDASSPRELIQIGLAWEAQDKKKLDKYKEYCEGFPSLEKFFI